eukprot:1963601-Rhodomonas_salina.2
MRERKEGRKGRRGSWDVSGHRREQRCAAETDVNNACESANSEHAIREPSKSNMSILDEMGQYPSRPRMSVPEH